MIKLYNLLSYIKELSTEVKAVAGCITAVVVCVSFLVSQCNENRKLRAEIESRMNVESIKSDIKDIKDLSESIKPPSLKEIKDANRKEHQNSIDSDSPTF